MAASSTSSVNYTRETVSGRYNMSPRVSFAKLHEPLTPPNLLGVQTDSFEWLIGAPAWKANALAAGETNPVSGLEEVFEEISPIEDYNGTMSLSFTNPTFEPSKYSPAACKQKDLTYSAPLYVSAEFENLTTGEIKTQTVYMGDFPLMTDQGTFIVNGTERVVVSQLVRSPGVYFEKSLDKPSGRDLWTVKFIPSRGAWLEFEVDKRDSVGVRIDRKRKQSATVFLKALGMTEEEIRETFADYPALLATLDADTDDSRKTKIRTQEDAVLEIYRRIRPGEPATVEGGKTLLRNYYFDAKRYDLAKVGRYKLNKKLGLDAANDDRVLSIEDIVASLRYLLSLHQGLDAMPAVDGQHEVRVEADDIDHFGNRRIRTVGELIQNQFRTGMSRMERVVRERMTTTQVEAITPQKLINIRPVAAAIKEFFGTSQLSQFMDQNNPLAGITHKRRLSALGPGGLSRDRAGMEVRDVHTSHYGRMCPIETPEGPNIGLIGSLATFARVNAFGFVETPYRKVVDSKVTDEVVYLTADDEKRALIAQASAKLDQDGKFAEDMVLCRIGAGDPVLAAPEDIEYMDVSARQMVSVGTALIPFLEHDDANRALMGANMQRQAVPLLRTEAPLVGTGMEQLSALDSRDVLLAKRSGTVTMVDATMIRVEADEQPEGQNALDRRLGIDEYYVTKFERSNQSNCYNQKVLVKKGDHVEAGQVLADGPATHNGEIALGRNLLVAFMSWEGYNYEDAIILSQRVVSDDILTSIHIEEHEISARSTKLGPEEITADIPNVSQNALRNLDEDGIIRVGAEVSAGDILVGKVTPKGETELTSEARLLNAIFGEKAREVRDTSLRVPHGESGVVTAVHRIKAEDADDELPVGVSEMVRVYIAQRRKITVGDKMAGRHGNKGVVSNILPVEDMPFLEDGTPVDIILNPMGVPGRMNIGQVFEIHLGWIASQGWDITEARKIAQEWSKKIPVQAEKAEPWTRVATPVFDGATADELAGLLQHTLPGEDGKRLVNAQGKAQLFDGRSGEPFPFPISVGYMYMLKLHHLVDDKIHARATGPYSMITQQPLGGKAQFGGQRFGEMEVWALEAYGAAHTLQEILTVKSDDVTGRVNVYEAIVKGDNIPDAGIPESFKVLVEEMKSLCLNVEALDVEGNVIELRDTDEDVYRSAENLGIDLARRPDASASIDEL